MSDSNREYQTIIAKIDLLSQKLESYKEISDEKLETYRQSNQEINSSMRAEIKAYQDANRQQLNVSLGVLVTAAIAILASVVLS